MNISNKKSKGYTKVTPTPVLVTYTKNLPPKNTFFVLNNS